MKTRCLKETSELRLKNLSQNAWVDWKKLQLHAAIIRVLKLLVN
jgi:hypothetical protein